MADSSGMTRTCPNCHAEAADPAAVYCSHCGHAYAAPADSPQQAPSSQEPQVEPGPAATSSYPLVPAGSGAPPTSEARNWALLAHLSVLVTILGIPWVVGPLVVWLLARNKDPFTVEHAREALNFNLSVLIYALVGGFVAVVLAIVTLGIGLLAIIPAVVAAAVVWIVFVIMAALEASKGRLYRYPLTIRLVN